MEDRKKFNYQSVLMPILLAFVMAVSLYLGTLITQPQSESFFFPTKEQKISGLNKLNELLHFVEEAYVDTINKNQLLEKSFNDILQSLDPHSYYIPPAEFDEANEPLEGNFEGIGIEFRIINDTVTVISTIGGGPSEKAGLLSGDKIILANDSVIAGHNITNEKVMKLLKGPRGTNVKIGVLRKMKSETLFFTIKRDKIPIYSIDASYMIAPKIGYIKINKFAKNTYFEFLEAAENLKNKGMEKMIIDLRNNGGGVMNAAIEIADEFLDQRKMIVYTKGRKRNKEAYLATSKGNYHDLPLAVLINENSASASEILAGAIQDNDRGIIIGRRSFGKGLVQEQIEFPDHSAIRLTVARYYTPAGRNIQKPYNDGLDNYRHETYIRMEKGELFSVDSIKYPDSLKFFTPKGKVVYGGGGIMPDYFVPIDTIGYTMYLSNLHGNAVFQEFAFYYMEKEKKKLSMYKNLNDFKKLFQVNEPVLLSFYKYAEELGVSKTENEIKLSKKIIQNRIKAHIARYLWKEEGLYSVLNEEDIMIKETVKLLSK
ncbi:MAG: S41 family peptidase [Flavobacteriales bacterium]|nr:S41 family peptidase [Flavobacteriales bacterium]NUM51423.1 S41 family peptidase [Flavobacteriales bacterium]